MLRGHGRGGALVALSLFLLFIPTTIADGCTPTTSDPEVASGGFYVENDPCQPGCTWSTRVYQETNGIDGLQRGDEVVDDTCRGQIEADTQVCEGPACLVWIPLRSDD